MCDSARIRKRGGGSEGFFTVRGLPLDTQRISSSSVARYPVHSDSGWSDRIVRFPAITRSELNAAYSSIQATKQNDDYNVI